MSRCKLLPIAMAVCPNCKENLKDNIKTNEGGFQSFSDVFPEIVVHSTGYSQLEEYSQQCSVCALPMNLIFDEKGDVTLFQYPGDLLLAIQNRIAFLDWKKRQLNGWISVSLLTRASCSIEGNLGAADYSGFIRDILKDSNVILDVGCGNQEMPSYLVTNSTEGKTIIGLDPFPSLFSGTLVRGVAEFIPLKNSSVDMVNCASTIDHFMNLDFSLREIERVVKPGGVLAIWDHSGATDQEGSPRILTRLRERFKEIQIRKFRVYANGVLFKLDDHNEDPFHSRDSREKNWAKNLHFKLVALNFEVIDHLELAGFSLWRKLP